MVKIGLLHNMVELAYFIKQLLSDFKDGKHFRAVLWKAVSYNVIPEELLDTVILEWAPMREMQYISKISKPRTA